MHTCTHTQGRVKGGLTYLKMITCCDIYETSRKVNVEKLFGARYHK